MLSSLLITLATISIGFLSGVVLRTVRPSYISQLNFWCSRLAIQGAIPFSLLLAIWQLEHVAASFFLLAIAGTVVILSGGALAWGWGRYFKLSRPELGAYIPAGLFMNLGAVGIFCVYIFLGENGLALVPFYKLFEEVIYFTIAFPLAARMGTRQQSTPRPFWRDPLLLTTVTAVTTGFILNLSGVPRPAVMAHVNTVIVPLGTYLLMISVGLVFRLQGMHGYWRPALALALSRAIVGPLCAVAITGALGFFSVQQGLPVKVALMLAVMPTAFLSLLPPALYGVNQHIANTSWLASSLLFFVTFPCALWVMQHWL